MKQLVCAVLVMGVLAACQTVPETLKTNVVEDDPLGLTRLDQTPALVERTQVRMRSLTPNVVRTDDYDYFRENDFGRTWLGRRGHKALAIGFPERCGHVGATWQYSTQEEAIQRAMEICLEETAPISQHVGEPCSCRLAALDDQILLSNNDLAYTPSVPTLIMIKPKDGSAPTEIVGYLQHPQEFGASVPLYFYNSSNTLICTGEYSLLKGAFGGGVSVDCFNGKIRGEGGFKDHGYRGRSIYGTAELETANETMYVIYGVSQEEFAARRAELAP